MDATHMWEIPADRVTFGVTRMSYTAARAVTIIGPVAWEPSMVRVRDLNGQAHRAFREHPHPHQDWKVTTMDNNENRPPLNGWTLLAAFDGIDARNWMIVAERPDGEEWVTAWVYTLTDPEWNHGNYFRAATFGAVIRDALERVGYNVEPITIHY